MRHSFASRVGRSGRCMLSACADSTAVNGFRPYVLGGRIRGRTFGTVELIRTFRKRGETVDSVNLTQVEVAINYSTCNRDIEGYKRIIVAKQPHRHEAARTKWVQCTN